MKLLVLTPSNNITNEQHIISKMFDMGLPTLHVRKPHLSLESLKMYLDEFSPEHRKKIIIHTHQSILWDYDLKGIHLTKEDKKRVYRTWFLQQMIRLRRGKVIVSTSCSSLSSLATGYKDFSYIMLTPIFASTQEHRPTFSRGTLDTIIAKYPEKIIARGGAKLDSVEKAKEMGFAGIAFHNSIWKSEEPLKAFENIINRYKELGIPIN